MPLFAIITTNKVERLKEVGFKAEKQLQHLVEENLHEMLGLQFVQTEFAHGSLRVDTLAFNQETRSFVIIEYKNDRNFSVIDQGYAYLALLLNNKADFILEYNEFMNKSLKRDDVDWSQSRVIFISPEFTKYQRQANNFKDLPIELWEVTRYANGTFLFNQLISPESSESIEVVSNKVSRVKEVSREIKVYSETDLTKDIPEEITDLYEDLKERILNFGDVQIVPRKLYIAFKSTSNFVVFVLMKSKIVINLNMKIGTLDDPKKLARDVSKMSRWGSGDYEISIGPESDVDYISLLIKQSYSKQK